MPDMKGLWHLRELVSRPRAPSGNRAPATSHGRSVPRDLVRRAPPSDPMDPLRAATFQRQRTLTQSCLSASISPIRSPAPLPSGTGPSGPLAVGLTRKVRTFSKSPPQEGPLEGRPARNHNLRAS